MKIIYGLIGICIGFLLIRYSFQLTEWLGRMDSAEKYLGGTTTMYRLVGLAFIILSLLFMFGGFGLVAGPLAPLFGGTK